MRSFNDKLIEKIARAPKVFFFLDYDGTLTSIVRKPERAMLNSATRSALRSLSHFPGIRIAVVSGRSLLDLQNMVGTVSGIIYVGNHGLEMKGEGFAWSHPSVKQASKIMERIWDGLSKDLLPVKGMLLENKVLGISLHYRLVSERRVAALSRDFQEIIAPWVQLGLVKVHEGKKVWEIRSHQRLWNKGKVVRWLLEKYKEDGLFLPVFIGDDGTDEDAFKALRASGITVKVTENPRALSFAQFYIHSPTEVFDFLKQVTDLRRSHSKRITL